MLESIRCKFFWGGHGLGKKLSWVKWDLALLPYDSGGLNIGSLQAKNLALLGKWWWRFKNEPNALWVSIIKSIYGAGGGFSLTSSYLRRFSDYGSSWAGIIKAGNGISEFEAGFHDSFRKQVGNGSSTAFWSETWLGNTAFKDKFPRLYTIEEDKAASVFDRVSFQNDTCEGRWRWTRQPRGRALGELDSLIQLLSTHVQNSRTTDSWEWKWDLNGIFTTKALTIIIDRKKLPTNPKLAVTPRNTAAPQKVNIFVWRALQKRIPVRFELDKRGLDLDSLLCPLCGDIVETVEHILIDCPKSKLVWSQFCRWWNCDIQELSSLDRVFSQECFCPSSSIGKTIWQASKWISGYTIWKYRNNKVFRNKDGSPVTILIEIQLQSFQWISKRLKKSNLEWHQWLINPGFFVLPSNKAGIG